MFEPNTYWELRAATNEALLNALIQQLPEETKGAMGPILGQYANQMEALKARHVVSLDLELATQPIIPDVLRAELVRVCAKATAPQFDGERQTSAPVLTGFVPEGVDVNDEEYKSWVADLPSYEKTFVGKRGNVPSGFYNFGGQPLFVVNSERGGDLFLNLIRFDGIGISINSIVPTRMPMDFNWESPVAGEMHYSEFFDYIGHLDVDAFIAAWEEHATERFLPITRPEYDLYFNVQQPEEAAVEETAVEEGAAVPVVEEPNPVDAPADVPATGVSQTIDHDAK